MKKTRFILIALSIIAFSVNLTGNSVPAEKDSIVSPQFAPEGSDWIGSDIQTIDEYLDQYVRYPESSGKKKHLGTEVVEFVVTTGGQLTDFRVINSLSKAIDQEMIRALSQTQGMWKPGLLNGVPVPMKKEVSLVFVPGDNYNLTEIAKKHLDSGNEALFEKKNPKRALKHFDQAVKIFPYNKDILSLRSLCRYELGDKQGAREDWKRIVDMEIIGEAAQLETGHLIVKMQSLEGYEELSETIGEGF
ncbi:MAG TPA: hypothetical protein ENO05_05815 [Bacteroides sp.]|nr:hypothetical protein [Bacteroides sp.]